MNGKIKYGLEKELINENDVVDPINQSTFQKPLYLDGYPETINVDLSKSNYFIIDLEDGGSIDIERNVSLNPINDVGVQRFEVLFIEPYGIRKFNFDKTKFQIHPFFFDSNFDEFFKMKENQRREMLISFMRSDDVFLGVPSCWFYSKLLNVNILFNLKDQNNEPVSGVSIFIENTYGGFSVEYGRVVNGLLLFSKPKGYPYFYFAVSGITVLFFGYISSVQSNQDFVEIEKTITN